jgi:hypothetical protein
MKRFIPALLVLIAPLTARASWTWQVQPSGLYWSVWEATGQNDGYAYRRESYCYNGCNSYRYVKDHALVVSTIPNINSPTFWDEALRSDYKLASDELKSNFLFARFPNHRTEIAQQLSGTISGQTVRNVAGYYQPGFPGGTSFNAVAGGTPYIQPVDPREVMHYSDRQNERAVQLAQITAAMTNDGGKTLLEANKQALMFQAFVTGIQQPASGQVTTFTQTIGQQPVYASQQLPPANDQASGTVQRLMAIGVGARVDSCSACHNPTKRSGNLDITSADDLVKYRDEIVARIHIPIGQPGHMPKGKTLSDGVIAAIESALPPSNGGGQVEQPIQPQPQPSPIPSPTTDQPPAPPTEGTASVPMPTDGTPTAPQN